MIEMSLYAAVYSDNSTVDRSLRSRSANSPRTMVFSTRLVMAGLEPEEFSAHGLRSGYLTQAANLGHPAHRSHGAITPSLGSADIQLL